MGLPMVAHNTTGGLMERILWIEEREDDAGVEDYLAHSSPNASRFVAALKPGAEPIKRLERVSGRGKHESPAIDGDVQLVVRLDVSGPQCVGLKGHLMVAGHPSEPAPSLYFSSHE
jgi:hypothetical protein